MKEPLPGWKTYAAAGIAALIGFAQSVGWLTAEQAQAALAFAAAFGLVALRMAVARLPAAMADATVQAALPGQAMDRPGPHHPPAGF